MKKMTDSICINYESISQQLTRIITGCYLMTSVR